MAKAKPLPDQETLNRLIDYDPKTGILTWKPRDISFFKGRDPYARCAAWNTRWSGRPALARKAIYLEGNLFNEKRRAHEVAFKIYYGFEAEMIDHLNGDKHDNRIINLRTSSSIENSRNMAIGSRNTSGVIGVYFNKQCKKWCAQISIGNDKTRHISLGLFETKSEAEIARRSAEIKNGYHANHGRRPHNP